MVAYEYYGRNDIRGYELIGVLPERRKDIDRVTAKSIIALGKKFWGDNVEMGDILFIRVSINKMTGEISRPKAPLGFDHEGSESRIERQGARVGTIF